METSFTKASIMRFLDTAIAQGVYNPNTGGGLRAAANKLLEEVQDDEDVRNIDIHAAMLRYNNRHPGELRGSVLGEYERRLKRLLREFEDYSSNPAAFRPRSRSPGQKGEGATRQKRATGQSKEIPETHRIIDITAESRQLSSEPTGSPKLALSYPLRDDFLAELVLPRDMTTDEARRIGAFIATLAKDFKPG